MTFLVKSEESQENKVIRPLAHPAVLHCSTRPANIRRQHKVTTFLVLGRDANDYFSLEHPLYQSLQDGIQEPRGGKLARVLPNPRWMSKRNHPEKDRPDRRYTHMVMQFGQFLDHDITLTPKDGNLITPFCL